MTRARWYWRCPHGREEFEPTFDRLQYPAEGTPGERGAGAFMPCLHCGGVIDPEGKAALNRAGRWLYEGAAGELVPLGDKIGKTATVSGSRLGTDIRYALGHWHGLTRFLEDGRLELDTNPVENAIRPVALTRKNALFAGDEVGAESWALLASLVATCKLNGADPVAYLAATLRVILDGHPQSRIEDLMPWRFRAPSSRTA